MPSYKPEHSQWYLLAAQGSADGGDASNDAGRPRPSRTPSASSSHQSVRELNNGFSMDADGRVLWDKTMSVGEPQLANVLAERGVDLSKKYQLTQTSQGAIYSTTDPSKLCKQIEALHCDLLIKRRTL